MMGNPVTPVMAARSDPTGRADDPPDYPGVGIDHPTVVPANFDPEDGRRETGDEKYTVRHNK